MTPREMLKKDWMDTDITEGHRFAIWWLNRLPQDQQDQLLETCNTFYSQDIDDVLNDEELAELYARWNIEREET